LCFSKFFYFFFFFFTILLSSFLVIKLTNPIHSVLFLILVFINVCFFLLFLEVEFLAMVFLIIYVGAISVLFLFVIMMLNIKKVQTEKNIIYQIPIFLFFCFFVFWGLVIIEKYNFIFLESTVFLATFTDWNYKVSIYTNLNVLGQIIYNYYFHLFILASIVLFVSMIGVIILTLKYGQNVKRQQPSQQVARNIATSINFTVLMRDNSSKKN